MHFDAPSPGYLAATSVPPSARLEAPPGLEDRPAGAPPPIAALEVVKLARTAAGRLVLTLADGSLAPKGHCGASAAADCQSTASGGRSAASEEAEEETPKKKKKSRYCKAKRDHYRRLVEQLVQQLQENPETFTLDIARLPRSIAACQESRERLLSTVVKFAAAPEGFAV